MEVTYRDSKIMIWFFEKWRHSIIIELYAIKFKKDKKMSFICNYFILEISKLTYILCNSIIKIAGLRKDVKKKKINKVAR